MKQPRTIIFRRTVTVFFVDGDSETYEAVRSFTDKIYPWWDKQSRIWKDGDAPIDPVELYGSDLHFLTSEGRWIIPSTSIRKTVMGPILHKVL
jgi:hypothetical protein